MDYISGIDKIRLKGGQVKILDGRGIEVSLKSTNKSDLQMKENVICVKCGKEMPFLLALFHKITDKPYCTSCCGYGIDKNGEVVSIKDEVMEVKSIVVDSEYIKKHMAKGEVPLMLKPREIDYLKYFLREEVLCMIDEVKTNNDLSEKDKSEANLTILEGAGILMRIYEFLGEKIPNQLIAVIEITKKMEEDNLKNAMKEKSKVSNEKHKNCICPECRAKRDKLN